ncbi:MAG: sulfurtransferase [Candidatus Krumholzibacteriota bacterium]|nr:sulfurtransferase [Candidatus Krumholzibacteriota bacterium]
MKIKLTFAALLAFAMIFAQVVSAQVISVEELSAMIEKGDVIVVSARNSADYAKVHLPGAINLWHKDFYKEGDIKALCKSPDEIAAILGAKGIDPDKTIVVYDDGKGKSAGRIYWILKYMGCKDVRILDGHMKMWRKGRKPVTKKATEVAALKYTGVVNPAFCACTKDVKACIGNAAVVLVDVRAKDEFDGEKGDLERKGHIPGAIHFDFSNVLNEDGTFKGKAELKKAFSEAGITPEKEAILYCESSVRAGIVFMALTSILEYPNVKVYDGAMYEWTADPENPVE